MKTDLAIILPVLNCLAYTKQMLPTIRTKYPYNLILINNASEDGTKDFFEMMKENDEVTVFNFTVNKGCAWSWNFGISFAIKNFNSKYFFIPNNDILLNPRTIDVLIEATKTARAVLTTATDISGMVSASVDVLSLKPPIRRQFVEAPDFSCFLLTKEAIDKVGYFDEKFYPAYFEDNDYHRRINLAGLRVIRTNQALYFHYGSRTIKDGPEIRTKANIGYSINREYYKEKWGGIPGHEIFKKPFGGKK
jgi:GT2 family glycosyltransferase